MEVTTAGRFRVYRSPRERDELLLLERPEEAVDWTDPEAAADADGAFSPTYVPRTGYDDEDIADTIEALEPGNEIEATLAWDDGDPRFAAVSVTDRTRFRFVGAATGLFEAARETWHRMDSGEAIGSRVTYGTDGDPNAVLYVFAKQPGARDLFEEFRDGVVPLDPLIGRLAAETDAATTGAESTVPDAPREVFVLRPLDEEFVLVAIAFDRDGVFAQTVRETYC
ncbi:hypothetical protein GJR96_02645 [Haloferax sp. MBLA0076]|uniref:Uncharacterized protein n=1 Tax=Haloferax litoreum TaxID=2666140 RepID=A0A6A8GCF6_9EURY|nr:MULTISPECIES: DUF6663 family protein [Haloferax]KAB1192398.1 hypothetical protein Hfx1148_02630 [Haloferax sp. CBA1148]MRX20863.1 hypothetical protein [Haloferax litoreum]